MSTRYADSTMGINGSAPGRAPIGLAGTGPTGAGRGLVLPVDE